MDSTGYVLATIVGPSLAGGLVAVFGGALTFIAIGLSYGVAAIVIARAPEPLTRTNPTGRLVTDSWQGLTYTWHHRTLRGLGFSISVLNLVNGTLTIVIPLLVLQRLHLDERFVGLVIAVQGLTGVIAAFLFGRMDTRNRERRMLAVPMTMMGITVAILLGPLSFVVVLLVMAITGFLNGPIDIALFTLRQRRTDPSWTGRAFAVSMSFNYVGVPIGSGLAGAMASQSIDAAIVFGAVASFASAILAVAMVPSSE